MDVIVDVVESQHDVAQLAHTVGHHHGDDASAEIGDSDLHAVGIRKSVQSGATAVDISRKIIDDKARTGCLRFGGARTCAYDSRNQQEFSKHIHFRFAGFR